MDASVGLVIQCVGITLVMLLSFFIMRSIQTRALRYWTLAWTSLALALACLIVAFHIAKLDRKSTRLNSSHSQISYAVFCLKKKNKTHKPHLLIPTRHHRPLPNDRISTSARHRPLQRQILHPDPQKPRRPLRPVRFLYRHRP